MILWDQLFYLHSHVGALELERLLLLDLKLKMDEI